MKQNRRDGIHPVRNLRFLTGFTLLELLIAFTLFSVAMVVVSSVFGTGIVAWKRGEEESGFYQELRFTLDRMAVEFRNAVPYEKSPFEGKNELVSFALVRFPRTSPPEWVQVTYEAKPMADATTSLIRRITPFSKNVEEEETILSGLSEIHFAYPSFEEEEGWSWKESWESGESQKPPPFLRLELLKEGETWKKIFLIPMGEREAS